MPCLSRIRPSTDRILLEHLGGRLGEIEARHDVGHEAQRLAEHLAADRLAVFLVDEARIAVEWVWSTNLCGRNACSSVSTDGLGEDGIDEIGALQGHHVLVGQLVAACAP